VRGLRARDDLAQALGPKLERREVLLRGLPQGADDDITGGRVSAPVVALATGARGGIGSELTASERGAHPRDACTRGRCRGRRILRLTVLAASSCAIAAAAA
jgi:hypothetical protein